MASQNHFDKNGDYHVYRQDGTLWYTCPRSAFVQWGEQVKKINAEREKNRLVWQKLERDREYEKYVIADLAEQARQAGMKPRKTREEFDESGNL